MQKQPEQNPAFFSRAEETGKSYWWVPRFQNRRSVLLESSGVRAQRLNGDMVIWPRAASQLRNLVWMIPLLTRRRRWEETRKKRSPERAGDRGQTWFRTSHVGRQQQGAGALMASCSLAQYLAIWEPQN